MPSAEVYEKTQSVGAKLGTEHDGKSGPLYIFQKMVDLLQHGTDFPSSSFLFIDIEMYVYLSLSN